MALKDGDLIVFGTESQVKVEIRPIDVAAGTVAQYLDGVVDGLAKVRPRRSITHIHTSMTDYPARITIMIPI